MAIWTHDIACNEAEVPEALRSAYFNDCLFCGTGLDVVCNDTDQSEQTNGWSYACTKDVRHLKACAACGWWAIDRLHLVQDGIDSNWWADRAWGVLRDLSESDISVPIDELRRYLIARYEGRFRLNPKRFEEIVGSVFADFGYRVRVTSYSRDDRIDIVALDGDEGDVVGVQVKRYRNKIGCEQIRSFNGALILNGMTRGVFVTTSSFTSGAAQSAKRYRTLGYKIELWDSATLFDRLCVTQRSKQMSIEDFDEAVRVIWKTPKRYPLTRVP